MGSLMDIRRRMIADAPRLIYASGNPIQFSTDRAGKVKTALIIYDFVQSGSGTPSPGNIRPISGGADTVELHISSAQGVPDERTYIYQLQKPIGKGYFNFGTVSVCEKRMITLDGDAGWAAAGSKFYVQLKDDDFVSSTASDSNYISNMYQFERIQSSGSADVNIDKRFYLQRVLGNASWCRVWVYDSAYTLEQFKALLNTTPLQVTYPIKTYYEAHDPISVKTIVGNNYIQSNGKETRIYYWTH